MATAIGYQIFLTDPAQVATLQATYPTGIQIPPRQASSIYAAPIFNTDSNPNGPGQAPFILIAGGGIVTVITLTPYFNTENFTIPANTLPNQPVAADGFWVGYFYYSPAGGATVDPTPEPTPVLLGARRWAIGFELPRQGDVFSGTLTSLFSRAASRTVDGHGLALRSTTAGQTLTVTHGVATISWCERLYIRIQTLPTGGEDNFWFSQSSAFADVLMTITTSGAIKLYSKGSAAYPGTALFTSANLTVGQWYRIDLALRFASGSGASAIHGHATMYINGVQVFSGDASGGNGLDAVLLTSQSFLGADSTAGATHNLEIDVDDWIGANMVGALDAAGAPTVIGNPVATGSHIRRIIPTGFGPSHNAAAWTGGGWQGMTGIQPENSQTSMGLTTTTPGAVLQIATTYAPQGYGVASLFFNVFVNTGSAALAADTLSIVGLGSARNANPVTGPAWANPTSGVNRFPIYSVADNTDIRNLPSVTNPVFQFARSASAVSITVSGMTGVAEELINLGVEDGVAGARVLGVHNSAYPSIVQQLPPIGAVQVAAFTYIGNGTALDQALGCTPNWYIARRIDNGAQNGIWWTGMTGAHNWAFETVTNSVLPLINIPNALPGDSNLNATAHFSGTDASANANAQVYQVVMVGDLSMRYMLNAAFSHVAAVTPITNTLIDPTFTPDMGMFFQEAGSSNAVNGWWFKGIGHTAAQASPLNGAVNNNVATFGAGTVATQAALHGITPDTAMSLWRKNDGSGQTFFDLVTYTGNGAGGNRTIACALNGMSPIFAMVIPHNAASTIFRDPSHSGAHSTILPNTDTSTGITGGDINAITVGTTLNANLVVYDVFVIQGCSAVPGGWSPNCTYYPVTTVPRASSGPFPAPPAPAPALDAGCISFGTAVTELLLRLGDVNGVHWTVTECQRYLLESLRIWNAITCLARDRGTFSAASPNVFYDLPTVLKDQATGLINLRGYNLKDQDLLLDLQYQLEEAPNTSGWSGTAMFNLSQITAMMQRRRDQFLWETGQVVTRETSTPTPDANGRVALTADIIDVRRLAWNSFPVLRESEWGANAYKRTWPTAVPASAANPFAYSVTASPPLVAQLIPPPTAQGTLDTISMVLGSTLNPAAGVLLGVPDDFAWVTRWGVIRDLFDAPGPSNDPVRSKIANDMWTLGITMAKIMAVVLDVRVNGTPVRVVSIADADRYARSWQTTTGTPSRCVVAGSNLVAFVPPPNAGPYTILMDVVRNQPVPVAFTDCFYEGGVAQTAALLDYAEFLARYKEGPEQAQSALPLLQRFLTATGVAQAMDQARALTGRKPLLDEARRGEPKVPRQEPPSPRSPVEGS